MFNNSTLRRSLSLFSLFLFLAFNGNAQYSNFGNAFKNPGSNDCYTVTSNVGNQGGAVYNMTPIDLTNSFRIRLFVNLGANDGGADGMTFLMRSNPTVVPVGLTGGSLGVSGTNDSTLLVEMDTWDNANNNDVLYDHICIMRSDVIHGPYTNLSAPVMALPTGVNIEDGKEHELSVTWNTTTKELKVYFDCSLRTSYTGDIVNQVFNGNPIVYYGVTAATGGATNLQVACFSPGINLPNVINATCGDTILSLQLTTKAINCSSVDEDGTDFRLADSSRFKNGTGPVYYLGVKGAKPLNCNNVNKTDLVQIKLWKPLYYGDYTLVIKKGNKQSSLSPFCSHPDLNDYNDFDVPDYTTIQVRVRGNTPVQIDDQTHDVKNPTKVTVCLPQKDPFPVLKAVSAKAVDYYWTFNGDTIQQIDSIWATIEGTYTINVVDTFGCPGTDKVDVYFPPYPEINFDLPPYCDTILGGDPSNLPDLLIAPVSPSGGQWQWDYDFGPPDGYSTITKNDTLLTPFQGNYRLIYTDTAYAPGVPGCVSQLEFVLSRAAHPPEDPLNVEVWGDLSLCRGGDETTVMYVQDSLLKPNFKAKPGYGPNTPYTYRWYYNETPIAGFIEDSLVAEREGVYIVFVKDQYGCVGADTVDLKFVDKYPSFEVFCEALLNGNGRVYWASVPDAVYYLVSYDDGNNWTVVDTNFIVSRDIAGLKSLKVKAVFNNACRESDISEFYPCAATVLVPTIFTPNQDGLNEAFYIDGLEYFPGSHVKIFDRWGMTVYESDDYQNDWDGGDLVEGTYFYLVEVNDVQHSVKKGFITLLR